MPTSMQPYRAWSEGQIALERALFCLECELIFAGTAHCPRCADKTAWPLSQWLPSARVSAPLSPSRETGLPRRGLRIVDVDERVANR
jgi:hypothetical protein